MKFNVTLKAILRETSTVEVEAGHAQEASTKALDAYLESHPGAEVEKVYAEEAAAESSGEKTSE